MAIYFKGYDAADIRNVALFDLDESLGEVLPQLIRVANEHYGTNLVYEELTDFIHFAEVLQVPRDEVLEVFNSHGLNSLFTWYTKATQFVSDVRNGVTFGENLHIAIVTSRGNFWNNSIEHTLNQLESNLIPYDSLAVLDFHTNKIEWAKLVFGTKLKYVFEDSPKGLASSFDSGIQTFKNVTPYNGDVETHGEFCAVKNTIKMY